MGYKYSPMTYSEKNCTDKHIDLETKWPPFSIRHFQIHFLEENAWISIKFSLTFVLKGPINNIPALIQMMAWRRSGDKPLSEPIKCSLLTPVCVTRTQRVKLASGSTNYVSLTSLQIQLSTVRSICFHNDWSLLLSNIEMGVQCKSIHWWINVVPTEPEENTIS